MGTDAGLPARSQFMASASRKLSTSVGRPPRVLLGGWSEPPARTRGVCSASVPRSQVCPASGQAPSCGCADSSVECCTASIGWLATAPGRRTGVASNPVLALLDRQEKPTLVFREGGRRPIEQLRSGSLKLRQFDGFVGHASKVISKKVFDQLAARRQKFCDRASMTSEISDERLPYRIGDQTRC